MGGAARGGGGGGVAALSPSPSLRPGSCTGPGLPLREPGLCGLPLGVCVYGHAEVLGGWATAFSAVSQPSQDWGVWGAWTELGDASGAVAPCWCSAGGPAL